MNLIRNQDSTKEQKFKIEIQSACFIENNIYVGFSDGVIGTWDIKNGE